MRPGARLAAATAAVALACLPASAQGARFFYTGNELWSLCSGKSDYASGVCIGFVAGVADTLAVGTGILGLGRACFPEQVTEGQARDVVKRYLEQHPERRHYTAANLVAEALVEAFPCPP